MEGHGFITNHGLTVCEKTFKEFFLSPIEAQVYPWGHDLHKLEFSLRQEAFMQVSSFLAQCFLIVTPTYFLPFHNYFPLEGEWHIFFKQT